MEFLTVLLWTLAVLLVVVGLAGSILPMIPGVPILFVGLLLAAWINDFQQVGAWTLSALGLLTAASLVVDFGATAMSTRRYGAGRAAVIGATLGLLVGLFFGLAGFILGPFAGAFLGHIIARGTLSASARAGVGAWVGVLLGTVAKLVIGLLMVLVFVVAWFTGGP